MNDSKYFFNNEAIGIIAILAVLRECRAISYSKSMLILPFLLHSETNASLRRANTVVRSSEELMSKKLLFFGNFNERYYSLLPISVNSIMILREMGGISIFRKAIVYNADNTIDLDSNKLGKRASHIVKASIRLANLLLNEDDSSIYLKLRIQL